MAEVRNSSNSDLEQFRGIPDNIEKDILEDEGQRSDKCSSQSEDEEMSDGENPDQINYYRSESRTTHENETRTAESQPKLNQPSSSKEVDGKPIQENNSVWLPTVKSEVNEYQDKSSEEDEDKDNNSQEDQEDEEEKMDDESYPEDEDDTELAAFHLAEVSYGDDEQDSEKKEGSAGDSSDLCKTTKPSHKTTSKKRSTKRRLKTEEPKSSKGKVPENFVCSICGHMAQSFAALTEHIHKHTKENVQFCAHCNKIFRHRSNLIQHIMTKHTGTAQFKCDVCGLAFAKVSAFQRHQRTHTGERPFACSLCNYRSKNAGCLKEHMRKHTGEKPYACKHCDYTCSYSSMLSRHIAAQHEKKTFVCNHCDYKTNLVRNLSKHLKKHEVPLELACEKCDFVTNSKEKLKNHIVRKHLDNYPISLYVCSICKIKYRERKSIRRHMMKIHKSDLKGMKFERETVLTGQSN
ncbi:zinc finger protein 771-like isoform X2 [Macrosteles quadrilineatus]|uniref:zinc finger protein 771-like isoform X2 n=1 Tax=Macrosteles quadrilineatus TaxID=74068 RepID=UPI0023E11BD9|nr:zinc finger protein 771-like isoform X2 [Macrosteles quadrilineatus]